MTYTLIIQHKSREIVRKELTQEQIKKITGSVSTFGASWIIAAFKKHFSLDLGEYRLDEWSNIPGSTTIEIREEDLVALRLKKIRDLGI